MADITKDSELIKSLENKINQVKSEIAKVIVGQDQVVEELIISLFAKGHCLLIGVPGLAKTLLVKTISEAMDLKFSRIQFTPDLMPGDITGSEVIEDDISTGKKSFRFVKGPIFGNIVLADEVNRTPPKTQAALLEAMQEHEVTVAGDTYILEEPFFVLATQNPIEQEGTYPLPEAQLDRFMFNIMLDYPSFKEEMEIVRSTTVEKKAKVNKVISGNEIIAFQNLVRRVPVAENVIEFAVKLVRSTRPAFNDSKFVKDYISYGAGPRASQYLILGAKSRAAVRGKFTPDIDDVKAVALPVLRHRIVPSFSAEADSISASDIVSKLIADIK
ncbi:MAG: MoxR family ATPase [Candidatus Kapabacteria bacterium]|nr:MoxR family ATPase [Candidatus Kapabacteria bacterium]